MRLLHPIMPFITEEIWQNLPHEGESITLAKWPEVRAEFTNRTAEKEMKMLMEIIRSVRNIRAEVNTPMSKKINLMLKPKDVQVLASLEANKGYIERFCNPEVLEMDINLSSPEKSLTAVVTGVELFLPLADLINIEEELKRLENEWEKWNKEVERVQKKLANERFVSKAPEAVVNEERAKEKDYLEKRAIVEERLTELKNM